MVQGLIGNPTYLDKALLIDIDGTIIVHETSKLIDGAREWVNKKYDEGWGIIFFTSRMEIDKELTEQTLKQYGFKYHYVIYNKPYAGKVFHIDDREFKSITTPRNIGVVSLDDDDLE